MLTQIAGVVAALAAVVLVGFLVPVLINLRKTTEEAERLLRRLNHELPNILRETTETLQGVNRVVADVQKGTVAARPLGQAIGAIGQTVNTVHDTIRGGTNAVVSNVSGWVAGVRAALNVLRRGSMSGSRAKMLSSQVMEKERERIP